MKKLMLGNEAVARGAYEAGVKVASSYPGTPSTEITEFIAKYDEIYSEWAPNEKVAVETAVGASIAGARAISAMKHVGLNVAADPLFTVSYIGTNGGLVIAVADDPGMHSSQNEQDSRNYAIGAKVPMLEPVSYTHLKTLESEGYQFEGAESSFELLIRKKLGRYTPFFGLEQFKVFSIAPVSYTHLDVYKRQSLPFNRFFCWH